MAMEVRQGGRRFAMVLVTAIVGLAGACVFRTVETGPVGVTTLFGKVTGERLAEGIHVVNPLKRVAEMSVRTQEVKEQAAVPSSEGLIMRIEASLLFRLDPSRAPEVYQRLGAGYPQVVIAPNFRSVMRAVTAAHTASALYSEGRETVAQKFTLDPIGSWSYSTPPSRCERGGIGRRAGFRFQWGYSRGGSSPLLRTD